MTKIDSWQCELCKKIFNNTEFGYSTPSSVDIYISSPSMYFAEVEIKMADVCLDCRNKISKKINEIFNR